MHLIFTIVSLALLVGFFILTRYETRRGTRIFASDRARLDGVVGRVEFILQHVNFGVFLRDEIRHLASRMGHDIVHISLLIVRSAERLLTRLIRHLRTHAEVDTAPRETAREFVKVLAEFKGNLKATHPEISDIQ
jgi:hypothetical protein